ncbi:hypothetical protein CVS54_01735 [Microbacterium oxydans]|uniref:DNA topoisomerase (ATP-hydrolyzing) n=1 Tax=Microbacterium oxydans TaxID=82380 RepID=A0A3Q9J3G7_9MICO|nr:MULTISPECIES: hypothetical protein [Microbacterium]AZS40406.1 hypothetical protein CVS54_01735 [Microbacterium oxydans]
MAYIAVMDRPEELVTVCANASDDADQVRRAIQDAFGIMALAADAVLSMQMRRFTPVERKRMQGELTALKANLT